MDNCGCGCCQNQKPARGSLRPSSNIKVRIPDDVIKDLESIATRLNFSSKEALIRLYIGQGMREEIKKFEGTE
jgi:hypothetical protein